MAELLMIRSLMPTEVNFDLNANRQNQPDYHVEQGQINEGFEETVGEVSVPISSSTLTSESKPTRDFHDPIPDAEIKPKPALKRTVSYKSYTEKEPAVEVKHAFKSYKAKGKALPILYNLNMTVEKGTIYSLLGSSGCGKTTLLTCVVGVRSLDSGVILINGAKAGSRESGVPGKNIGYMPQDIALYSDFSIMETLNYFGSLNGMSLDEINTRSQFLIDLLKIPEGSRRVGTLSGGQQRRVSVAVSLIHNAPLIILDEPTVGVDPLLRESIWKHLTQVVANGQTVIITTHYIDEAGDSDKVGVMRGGRLLAEKGPKSLYEDFHTNSLQEVVLKLCHNDENAEEGKGRARSKSSGNILSAVDIVVRKLSHPSINGYNKSYSPFESLKETLSPDAIRASRIRIQSLIRKNAMVLTRNIALLIFAIVNPAVQTLLLGYAVGKDPQPLFMGVVNHELNGSLCDQSLMADLPPCIIANLSCKYLEAFPPDIIHFINYESEDSARKDITAGELQGLMSFPDNYTDCIYQRVAGGTIVDNDTIDGSMVTFEMDASNAVITKAVQNIIYQSYQKFVQGLLLDCGFNPEVGGLPVRFMNPIYGHYDMQFHEYIAIGAMIAVAFFFPVCTAAVSYIWDKKQGTMERARVSGTKTWEIITAFFVTEGLVAVTQVVGLFAIIMLIFQIPILGSLGLAFLIVLLNGLAGISLGLLFGAICSQEIQAVLLALAVITPSLFLSGAIWPIKGMPPVIQHLTYIVPGSLGSEAFRAIVTKGWGFTHFYVWTGIASMIGWICFYWIANLLVHSKFGRG